MSVIMSLCNCRCGYCDAMENEIFRVSDKKLEIDF